MSLEQRMPYRITVYHDDWSVIEHWCNANIGKFDHEWYKLGIDPAEYIMYGDHRTTWLFKHERDAVLFRLRWS